MALHIQKVVLGWMPIVLQPKSMGHLPTPVAAPIGWAGFGLRFKWKSGDVMEFLGGQKGKSAGICCVSNQQVNVST